MDLSVKVYNEELAYHLYFTDRENLIVSYKEKRLGISKAAEFVLGSILDGSIEYIDMELYSLSVNASYARFKRTEEANKPIHGTFYPELRQRYFDLLSTNPVKDSDHPTRDSHLAWMLTELSDPTSAMSETKKHRWLGYIQGCMTMTGLINVNEEREKTRPLFNGK